MGTTYKLKPSPSTQPDSRNIHIPLGSTSYVSGFCIRFPYKSVLNRPKQSNNNMGAQSGVNLTGMTMSSQSCELKTSSIADRDTTITPPPAGGGSKTGAQESPSTSNIEIEYDVVLPDKGKGKAVPDNTVQGGSGHDPPREWERTSHLSR